jgi:threonine/homoserine/homoserine lactone efflux protein
MVTSVQILSFLLAAILITATPGPDNLMVLSMGMSKGRLQGVAFGLGCAFGCMSHTILAVLGISAVVAASPLAFTALKWLGGAYLIWLGVNALRTAGSGNLVAKKSLEGASVKTLFLKGMVANAINPKVVLFFLSFLPQFVIPANGSLGLQLGILGFLFTAQAAILFGLLGYFSGSIGGWLNRRPRASLWMDRIAGTVFVGIGIRMMVSR